MLFSLIVPTLGRTKELKRLLESLEDQSVDSFEVIVVDQNEDDRLDKIISPFSKQLEIKHIKTSLKGAARARNRGVEEAHGELLAFPDDDCWYPPGVLSEVKKIMTENPGYDGIMGRAMRPDGEESLGRWDSDAGYLTTYNLWVRHIEFTMFLTADGFRKVGGFDETIGPGAGSPWGCGESADLVLNMLAEGYKLYYKPELEIFHPVTVNAQEIGQYSEEVLKRNYRYAMGLGHVFARHGYPYWFMGYQLIRPIGGMLLSVLKLDMGKARYYLSSLKGRFNGIRETKKLEKNAG